MSEALDFEKFESWNLNDILGKSPTKEEVEEVSGLDLNLKFFEGDFDGGCRLIRVLCHFLPSEYNQDFLHIAQNIFLLTTLFEFRLSPKSIQTSSHHLGKSSDILSRKLLTLDVTRVPAFKQNFSVTSRIFMAFSLVNMHEIIAVSKSEPVNLIAQNVFKNEFDTHFSDYVFCLALDVKSDNQIGKRLDAMANEDGFKKCFKPSNNKQIEFCKNIERMIVLWYGTLHFVGLLTVVAITEVCITFLVT